MSATVLGYPVLAQEALTCTRSCPSNFAVWIIWHSSAEAALHILFVLDMQPTLEARSPFKCRHSQSLACVADLTEGNLTGESLQSAREEWRANLDDLLDSNTDLQRLRTRADDLKVELIRIQTPPREHLAGAICLGIVSLPLV